MLYGFAFIFPAQKSRSTAAINVVRVCTEIEVRLKCTACIYYCTVGSEIEVLSMHRNRDSLLLVKSLG